MRPQINADNLSNSPRWPKCQIYLACLDHQQRPDDSYMFCRPCEQFSIRNQEIATGKSGELLRRKRVRDRSDAGPVPLAHTHGARFTTRIKHAATNLIGRELPHRFRHEIRLGVGCGITIRGHCVLRGEDDLAADDEECPKWRVASRSGLSRQFDGLSREGFVDVHRDHTSSATRRTSLTVVLSKTIPP